jgi:hypothetical protein
MNCGLKHFENDVMQLSYRHVSIWHMTGLWIGAALKKRLTQTKPVLPLSNEHGSQVKDEGRRQCCHNKHKYFPIGLHVMYLYFPDTSRIYRQYVSTISALDSFVSFMSVTYMYFWETFWLSGAYLAFAKRVVVEVNSCLRITWIVYSLTHLIFCCHCH